jgi:hypothetical protein
MADQRSEIRAQVRDLHIEGYMILAFESAKSMNGVAAELKKAFGIPEAPKATNAKKVGGQEGHRRHPAL